MAGILQYNLLLVNKDKIYQMLMTELIAIGSFIRKNGIELTVVSSAILFLVLSEQHSIGEEWVDALFFYAALPLFVILILRKNPLNYGLRLGNCRLWGFYVVITCLIALPVLFGVSKLDSLQSYYTMTDFNLFDYFWRTLIYLAAWEFIFRGYMLFGLKNKFKKASIFIQMIPFVLLHLGKPEIEIISTIPMGIFFGWVTYRGNSVWPAVIIHVFINIVFRIIVN